VAVVVLGLAGAAWYVLVHRPGAAASSPAEVLNAIAALDARYLGREAETPEQDWTAYQIERRRLKAQLEAALAAGAAAR
jgi:hypothetical protein